MELWIRSQDKMKLAREIDLRIVLEQEGASLIDETTDYILGTYKTKERVLEVLDEIEDLLVPKLHHVCDRDLEGNEVKVLGLDYIQSIVYQMPEE